MEGNSVRERMRVAERLRRSERKVEGKIGATFSRKGRAGRNERWAEREREREEKSETAVTGKRGGWKTGDSGREWTARAISGGD